MLRRMVLCRFLCVLGSLEMVSVSNVSVVSCLFMRARLMMLCRFKMMACGMLMVLGRLLVVLCTLVSGHWLWSPFADALCARGSNFLDLNVETQLNTHRRNPSSKLPVAKKSKSHELTCLP
jgi:hypothetical protein